MSTYQVFKREFIIFQVFYVEFLHPGIHTFSGVCSIQRSFTAASAGGRHLDFCPPRHYLRPPRGQLLRITRWRRECAGLMGRLAVSVHQESPRSAAIWARTRIFPNSKHGKIFFLEMKSELPLTTVVVVVF